jgi:hypothetical protein
LLWVTICLNILKITLNINKHNEWELLEIYQYSLCPPLESFKDSFCYCY